MNFLRTASILLLTAVSGQASSETLLLRQPALSAEQLAFVYAGDIWVANRDGSQPRRLTTAAAEENTPMFSPDGTQIAFAAAYEDNVDVYVVAAAGGQPQRLTWHPGEDIPVDWQRDGRAVALVSARETDHGRSGQLYHVSLAGGLPQKQMAARFYRGSYDASGNLLAYIDHGSGYNGLFGGTAGWQGYRGGTIPSIRIMNLHTDEVSAVPGERVNDFNTFWLGDQLYFLSDRDASKTFNLYRYDPASAAITALTRHDGRAGDWDIRAAAGHGDSIVYEAGGRLTMLDLATGNSQALAIDIAPDLPQLRPGWKSVAGNIQNIDISPTGKRAIVTARGEVFTVPVEDGSLRNLSNTDGSREYTGLWSPAGDQVAWIIDGLDGQQLAIADQQGAAIARTLKLGPHFYELMAWNQPRGLIIYRDNHLRLYSIDVKSGERTEIATNARRAGFEIAISPDGRWLAHTLEQPNLHSDLVLHDFNDASSRIVTDGQADVAAPAFSADGEYLYFAASTNSGPIQFGLNMTSQERPYRAGLYALVLAADGNSPLTPKPGDEAADAADDKDADKQNDGQDKSKKDKPKPVRIDFAGLSQRMVGLPVAEGNYRSLQVAQNGMLFYIEDEQPGASVPPPDAEPEGGLLRRFDFDELDSDIAMRNVSGFRISADGRQILLQQPGGKLSAGKIDKKLDLQPLDLSALRMFIDPRQEWAQIFAEAWRMEQEYFYAGNLHGLDWNAVYAKYQPLVQHVGRREDLNTLLVEMIGELEAGHNRAGGGDVHQENAVDVGLLGANLAIEDGHYRITRIYSGEQWNPFLRGPLAVPGNEARVGDYILAVNAVALDHTENIFQRLQNTTGKQLALTLADNPAGEDTRDIVIEPVASERELRLWSWIERNRRQVDEASDGRVGYIYLPNTAGAGYTFFNRMFFPQLDKQALIIDERSNSGGQAANYIVEVLSRRHLSSWQDRDGLNTNTPAGAMHGPKLMLIDQDAGSGGDYLPYAFRQLGIGKLLGTRTWGGLIGISANPQLVDGGFLTVPFFRFIDADGNWSIENEGVAPDIEVELDPLATNAGSDSQLEAAISEILADLESWQDPVPAAPPLPTELGQ
ncbi:MAG: PDZ domain-containing protein [Gammaproteobacteria bacterium]|nr:PDZ domain-containing protein [Gammaproteobacteria bacterium]